MSLLRPSRTLASRICQRGYAVKATIDGPMPRDAAIREGTVSYTFSVEYQRVKSFNELSQRTPLIAQNPVVWKYAQKTFINKTIPSLEARYKKLKETESKLAANDETGRANVEREKAQIASAVGAILRLDATRYVNVEGLRSLLASPSEVSKRLDVIEADTVSAIENLDAVSAKNLLASF